MSFKNFKIVAGVFGALGLAALAHAQAPFDRGSDKVIEELFKSIDDKNSEFAESLDRDFRNSVVRGAQGETDVKAYLDDLDEAVKAAADRFGGEYSASTEVKTLLTRAAPAHTYVRAHPELSGASEWDQLAGDLNRLAQAYGATFPLASPDAPVRRIGDGELRTSLEALSGIGEEAGNALRRAARDTPALASNATSAAAFGETAEALQGRISKNQPATAEARQLQAAAAKLDGEMAAATVPGAVKDIWKPAGEHVAKIVQAFGL
jgi:hypothetical protein